MLDDGSGGGGGGGRWVGRGALFAHHAPMPYGVGLSVEVDSTESETVVYVCKECERVLEASETAGVLCLCVQIWVLNRAARF